MPESFLDAIRSIPGLKHYYPLTAAHRADDAVGHVNGTVHGNVRFEDDGAHFDGQSYIELPDHDDFSVTTTKELTIVAFVTVDDWSRRSHNNEYLHWMGKGHPERNAHEWTFRTYIDGGGGEAPQRRRRISFYHFLPSGGLGTGSFVQDSRAAEHVEMVISGEVTSKGSGPTPGYTQMWYNGRAVDKDMLTAYQTVPANTVSPVGIGSRGDNTGGLVGRIRRVMFFNRLLTEAEQTAIYNARNLPDAAAAPAAPPAAPATPPATPPASPTAAPMDAVVVGGNRFHLAGVDRDRKADELIAYTSKHGASTGTNVYGAEATIVDGKAVAVRRDAGDSPIPGNGVVLSGHGAAKTWLTTNIHVGTAVTIPEGLRPAPPAPPNPDIAVLNGLAGQLRAAKPTVGLAAAGALEAAAATLETAASHLS
jgi:hypothetical protein